MDMIDVMIPVAAHSEQFSVLKQSLCDFRGLWSLKYIEFVQIKYYSILQNVWLSDHVRPQWKDVKTWQIK